MKRILVSTQLIALLTFGHLSFATSTLLFDVRLAPLGLTLSNPGIPLQIGTTIPGKVYPFAGIKINTPGYSVVPGSGTHCTMEPNGYCLFSVVNTSPALLFVSIPITINQGDKRWMTPLPPVSLAMTLCLNGAGSTYSCEEHIVQSNPPG